jgi:hypothetical protein
MAAAWALIGFAAQCFLSLYLRDSFVDGMKKALLHYAAWGLAGLLVGSVLEGIIKDTFRNTVDARQKSLTPPTADQSTGESGPPGTSSA